MNTENLAYTTPKKASYTNGFVKVNSSQITDLNLNSIRNADDVNSWLEVFKIVKNLGVTQLDFLFEPTSYQVEAAKTVFTGLNDLILIEGNIAA